MIAIGPSTGWLYAKGINLTNQQEIIMQAAGADGFEVCMYGWGKNDERIISLRQENFNKKNFCYRSLHLPDVNDEEIERKIAITQEFTTLIGAVAALTHPLKVKGEYPLNAYERMIVNNIPLAVENMDKQKDSGYDLRELMRLTHFGLNFVLDVQHAYEHDSDMKYALDLFNSLRNKLVHFHVSGETESNNHSLLHKARNAKAIIEFLGTVLSIKKVPLILEGEYRNADELKQEIKFLRKELVLV